MSNNPSPHSKSAGSSPSSSTGRKSDGDDEEFEILGWTVSELSEFFMLLLQLQLHRSWVPTSLNLQINYYDM
jgi:hypothetical protein